MVADELDPDAIGQFLNDVGPAARELVTLFVNETRARLESMQSAGAKSDWLALANEAHALKSSAATYGLGGLSSRAAELEQACRADNPEQAKMYLGQISNNLEGMLDAFIAAVETQIK